jgi:ER degradation enhancer, mannosidase alpha-like 2
MFQHAYNGYLKYAHKYDELRPLSCDGINTWGSYSLTLVDALDTLAVMGNFTEFRRVVDVLLEKSNFEIDINVSVFETNIRIVGGLISAHLLSHKAGLDLEPGWPCNGPLLRLAEDVAKRLLPAFDTKTGMPYGTVNLKYGIPAGETTITCTACIGTFIVEFGALSRLTGDPIYEEVAMNAIYALYAHKSSIGLFGNHIDIQTGRWTAQDAGIGAGVDSYYEYLVKGSLMLNRPELMQMFNEGRKAIDKYLKRDDWHVWVSMNKGQVTLPVFQSLEAYWPGLLSLFGHTSAAMKTLHNYHTVWKQYGFLPEFYNIPNAEAGANRENYPLRPELIESVMYLYRATGDPYLLEVGEDMLRSIEYSAKTTCGYATIKNVRDHRKEDRMESFFLAETTKYLYLLFDPDNFLNNDGSAGTIINTPNGECVIESGGYIFNTEAHPIDPAALRCCYDVPRQSLLGGYSAKKFQGELFEFNEVKPVPEEPMEDSDVDALNMLETNGEKMSLNLDSGKMKNNLVGEILNALTENGLKKKLQLSEEMPKDLPKAKTDDSLILPIDNDPPASVEISDETTTEKPPDEDVEDPVEIIKLTSSARESYDHVTTTQLPLNSQPNEFLVDDDTVGMKEGDNQSNVKLSVPAGNKSLLEREILSILNNNSTNENNNSVLTDFVHSILKKNQPIKTKFDAQTLLEKVRKTGYYRNETWTKQYGLLTCQAQPYLQRVTVLGEFY